jgi:hypothetical protein
MLSSVWHPNLSAGTRRDHPNWTNARTPPPQIWMNFPTGISDVLYGANFG